jgi:hypothetical protein
MDRFGAEASLLRRRLRAIRLPRRAPQHRRTSAATGEKWQSTLISHGYADPSLTDLATEIGLQYAGTARIAVQKLVDYGYFGIIAGHGRRPSRYFPLASQSDQGPHPRRNPKHKETFESRRRQAIRLSRQLASQ